MRFYWCNDTYIAFVITPTLARKKKKKRHINKIMKKKKTLLTYLVLKPRFLHQTQGNLGIPSKVGQLNNNYHDF